MSVWGVKWVGGKPRRTHLIYRNGLPVLFRTRAEARAWVAKTHGYIKKRNDLRKDPHWWRLPMPTRVTVA